MMKVILNGKEIKANKGKTILEIATDNGIEIPTLCHDEELKSFGSCWVCAVEVKGRRGFVTSCGTEALDGMEIVTNSEEVFRARKMALELLLSDHFADCEAPCKLACPDLVDVQSYVALIANNQPHEAVKVIKDRLPMPLSIGRVCPAFCERECRRTLVEEPIAIRQLKRYAADIDIDDCWSYQPPKEESKEKKIAVIGAGPSGLTCGYYLSNRGYDVDVFEAAPEAGGWLRYGIPEYRLPKETLRKEIELMCANGMKIYTNKKLGKDITLASLSKEYDAVYLALGAQLAVPMKVKGEDLQGSWLGVDFLKKFMLGEKVDLGKKVAVIGGGNTAIDCARTAKRLGADVTIVYRRTRKEMPAEAYEVDAAEEEGVKFYFLTNPTEYKGEQNIINEVVMEKMQLGEPDASGRRRPEPTGEYFSEQFDSVIAAISQIPDVALFASDENKIDGKVLPITRWSTADVKENLLHTGLKNVFAGGDFRMGPATAIEAIADGRNVADIIDKFISTGLLEQLPQAKFISQKADKLTKLDKKIFSAYTQISREKMPELEANVRSGNFEEVETGFNDNGAKTEADRCLECGCLVNYHCDLRDYATAHNVDKKLFFGSTNQHPIDESHPFILRDANKCIKCGRCVRICSEIQGAGVLGYIYRGFQTLVAPEFGESLTYTDCEACGKCITVCPVGALVERNSNMKRYPLEDVSVEQSCGMCGTGCSVSVHISSGKVSYISASELVNFNHRNICFNGRFGWQVFEQNAINEPLLRVGKEWKAISSDEAGELILKQLKSCLEYRFTISPHASNEELMLIKNIADYRNSAFESLSYKKIFTDKLLAEYDNSCTYTDLNHADNIVVAGEISHTLRTICRTQQRKGKKLILITTENPKFNNFADVLYNGDNIDRLIQKYLGDSPLQGKTVIIYNRNHLSEANILKLWQYAASNFTFEQGSGLLETSDWSNLIGFRKAESSTAFVNSTEMEGRPCLHLHYGEQPVDKHINKGFTVLIDTHYNENTDADLLLPKPNYLEMEGTVFSDDGSLRHYCNPLRSNKFNNLLHILHEAHLIKGEQMETNVWHYRVDKLLVNESKPFNREILLDFLNGVAKESPSNDVNKENNYAKTLVDKLKNSCHKCSVKA